MMSEIARQASGMHPGWPLLEGAGFCCLLSRLTVESRGHLYVCTCLPEPGLSMGAPSASRCSGVCSTSVPEGFTPEGSPVFQDKDIPAINQGENTGPHSKAMLNVDMRKRLRGNVPMHAGKSSFMRKCLSVFLYSFAG
jgi:hypothetical protein